jgi:hypothetical protein
MRITSYIYKIIKNNRGKFSFLVCFLRSNGGLSRQRSATAEFPIHFLRPLYASFVRRCHLPLAPPSHRGRCRGNDGRPLPPAGGTFASSRHCRESFQAKVPDIWWGSPNLAASPSNRTINRTTEPSTALERRPIATPVIIWTLFHIKFASTSPLHIQHGITIRYDYYAKILARDPSDIQHGITIIRYDYYAKILARDPSGRQKNLTQRSF